MMTHAPEPWRKDELGNIVNADFMIYSNRWPCTMYRKEDVDRLIACVNACAGIPTEDLAQIRHAALVKIQGDKINEHMFGGHENRPPIPPSPRMLAEYLEIVWGVKTKVEYL